MATTVLSPPLHHYHRDRRRMHLLCFLIFCALPFFNVMRFDIPKQRMYFAGFELWINEFAILFYTLMFLMFVIAAVSMIYGRAYCAYACPQMIFSETFNWLETRAKRFVTKHFIQWTAHTRNAVARAIFYAALLVASVFLAFVFISYFVDPRDLLGRLFSLDIRTAGGIGGAAATLVIFADFAFLRQRFCTTVCPYGYIQGMLADKHTLLVRYDDPNGVCIDCKKCVRDCHMDIDIRKSPFQIECIHCGECIDSCDRVLARLKEPGLIHYAWGEKGEAFGQGLSPWWYRFGLRDAKRAILLLILTCYASGLVVALSMRHAVMVRISPDRATLYSRTSDGLILNRFKISVSNRSSAPSSVALSLEGLPGGQIFMPSNPVRVNPGQTTRLDLSVVAAPGGSASGVNHFQFVTQSGGRTNKVPMTFIMPSKESK